MGWFRNSTKPPEPKIELGGKKERTRRLRMPDTGLNDQREAIKTHPLTPAIKQMTEVDVKFEEYWEN
jgi:hypothetical protein